MTRSGFGLVRAFIIATLVSFVPAVLCAPVAQAQCVSSSFGVSLADGTTRGFTVNTLTGFNNYLNDVADRSAASVPAGDPLPFVLVDATNMNTTQLGALAVHPIIAQVPTGQGILGTFTIPQSLTSVNMQIILQRVCSEANLTINATSGANIMTVQQIQEVDNFFSVIDSVLNFPAARTMNLAAWEVSGQTVTGSGTINISPASLSGAADFRNIASTVNFVVPSPFDISGGSSSLAIRGNQLGALSFTGGGTLTVDGAMGTHDLATRASGVSLALVNSSVDSGATVTLSTSQADGKTIAGLGTVSINSGTYSSNASIAGITANTVVPSEESPISVGSGATLTMRDAQANGNIFTGAGTVAIAGGSIGSNTSVVAITANVASSTSSFSVASGATFTLLAAQANGQTISGDGATTISGNIDANASFTAIATTLNIPGSVSSGATLTLTANQGDGRSLSGAGSITIATEALTASKNFRGLTTAGFGFSGSIGSDATLSINAAQASGCTVSGAGSVDVLGTAGADTVGGGAISANTIASVLGGNDSVTSSSGVDSITLGEGNDSANAGAGNDSINGGAGIDNATVSSAFASTAFSAPSATITVTGADGVDSLSGVETVTCSDAVVHVIGTGGSAFSSLNGTLATAGASGKLYGILEINSLTFEDAAGLDAITARIVPNSIVSVDASSMSAVQLGAISSNIAFVNSIFNLSITATEDANEITNLFSKAADGAVVVNAAGMGEFQKDSLATGIAKVSSPMTGLALASTETDAQIATLLSKVAANGATANAASMNADQKGAMSVAIGKIASITDLALASSEDATEIGNLTGKCADASVTANAASMDDTQKGALSLAIGKILSISNLALASSEDATEIENLLGKTTGATAVATGMLSNQLSKLGAGAASIGADGVTGTLAVDVNVSDLGALLGKTSAEFATVNVDATDFTFGGKDTLTANITKIDSIVDLALASTEDATQIGQLLGKCSDESPTATAVATNMVPAQLSALGAGASKIATDGITGTLAVTAAVTDLGGLLGKTSADFATVNVDGTGFSSAGKGILSSNISKVDLINNLSLDKDDDAEEIANLTSKAPNGSVSVNANEMIADQKAALVSAIGKISVISNLVLANSENVDAINTLLGKAIGATVNATTMSTDQLNAIAANALSNPGCIAANGIGGTYVLTKDYSAAHITAILGLTSNAVINMADMAPDQIASVNGLMSAVGTVSNFKVRINQTAAEVTTTVQYDLFLDTRNDFSGFPGAVARANALKAANPTNSYTVLAEAGAFNLHNVLTVGSITLEGAGRTEPGGSVWATRIITPAGLTAPTLVNSITVTGDNATIRGVQLEGYIESGVAVSRGITVDSGTLPVDGLTIDNVLSSLQQYGFGILSGESATDVTITDSKFAANGNGVTVEASGALDGLTMTGTLVSGNVYGFTSNADHTVATAGLPAVENANTVGLTNVNVSNCQFNSNQQKGLYFEKLSNATFTDITVDGNAVPGMPANNFGAGFELNLKYGAYSGITITNATVSNNGTLSGANGIGLAIKARDDAGGPAGARYNDKPSSLSTVAVNGGSVSGSARSLVVANNVAMNTVTFGAHLDSNLAISGSGIGVQIFGTVPSGPLNLGAISVADGASQYVQNGSTCAVNATGASFAGKTGATATRSENFAIAAKVFDSADAAGAGRVTVKAANVFVNSGATVALGVATAAANDTVNVQSGSYTDGSITINTAGLTIDSDAGALGYSFVLGTANSLTLAGAGAIDATGNGNANTISGGSGINALSGLVGDDSLSGGEGNDAIDGGTGIDSASYSGSYVDAITGSETLSVYGDSVVNVENLVFSDATVAVVGRGGSEYTTLNIALAASGSTKLWGELEVNSATPFSTAADLSAIYGRIVAGSTVAVNAAGMSAPQLSAVATANAGGYPLSNVTVNKDVPAADITALFAQTTGVIVVMNDMNPAQIASSNAGYAAGKTASVTGWTIRLMAGETVNSYDLYLDSRNGFAGFPGAVERATALKAAQGSGDTAYSVVMNAGTFGLQNRLFPARISIVGAGSGSVTGGAVVGGSIIDMSGAAMANNNAGIQVLGDGTQLRDFAVTSPTRVSGVSGAGYAIAGSGPQGDPNSVSRNATIQNIRVHNVQKTGLDMNTLVDSSISGCSVSSVAAGYGMAFSGASSNVSVSDLTVSGAAWGDVAAYPFPSSSANVPTGISFSGTLNITSINLQPYTNSMSVSSGVSGDFGYNAAANVRVPAAFNRQISFPGASTATRMLTRQGSVSGLQSALVTAGLPLAAQTVSNILGPVEQVRGGVALAGRGSLNADTNALLLSGDDVQMNVATTGGTIAMGETVFASGATISGTFTIANTSFSSTAAFNALIDASTTASRTVDVMNMSADQIAAVAGKIDAITVANVANAVYAVNTATAANFDNAFAVSGITPDAAYSALSAGGQLSVRTDMVSNRPEAGYATVSAADSLFNPLVAFRGAQLAVIDGASLTAADFASGARYPAVASAYSALPENTILDGELAAVANTGTVVTQFNALTDGGRGETYVLAAMNADANDDSISAMNTAFAGALETAQAYDALDAGLTSGNSASNITYLLGFSQPGATYANATGMLASQLNALAGSYTKIAANGITGTLAINKDVTTFANLLALAASSANVTVDMAGMNATQIAEVNANLGLIDSVTGAPVSITRVVESQVTTVGYQLTIQNGINYATAGDTVVVAAGSYSERLTIAKRITLDGAGKSDDPSLGTIITSIGSTESNIVVTSPATGVSATERLVIKDLRLTGATGAGNPGSGIRFRSSDAGLLLKHVTVDNVAAAGNAGYGIVLEGNQATAGTAGTSVIQDVIISNSDFSANNIGVRVASSANTVDGLAISNCSFSGNTAFGLQSNANSYDVDHTNFSISGSTFTGNGTSGYAGTSRVGDVSILSFNGNLSVSNVTITGLSANPADTGFSISGFGSTSVAPVAAGTMSFNNLSISGKYSRPAGTGASNPGGQGRAFSIKGYSSVASVTFVGCSINNSYGNSVEALGLGSVLNLGDTSFGAPSADAFGNSAFDTTSWNPNSGTYTAFSVVTGVSATDFVTGKSPVDASGCSFAGLGTDDAGRFGAQARLLDAIDGSTRGLVTLVSGNVFVASGGSVANGLAAAASGNTVKFDGAFTGGPFTVSTADLTLDAASGTSGLAFNLGSTNSVVLAGSGNADVNGNANANTVTANGGANVLTGDAGIDTANMGIATPASLAVSSGTIAVGADTVSSIERLGFTGGVTVAVIGVAGSEYTSLNGSLASLTAGEKLFGTLAINSETFSTGAELDALTARFISGSSISVDVLGMNAVQLAAVAANSTASGVVVYPPVQVVASDSTITGYFTTIQSAINSSSTAVGSAVKVAAGSYTEQFTINKDVTVQGPNAAVAGNGTRAAEAVLDYSEAANAAQFILVQQGALKGFKIVDNNVPTEASNRVCVDGSSGNVSNNLFHRDSGLSAGAGHPQRSSSFTALAVAQSDSSSATVSGNYFTGSSTGYTGAQRSWSHGVRVSGSGGTVSLASNALDYVRYPMTLGGGISTVTLTGNSVNAEGVDSLTFAAVTGSSYTLGANSFTNPGRVVVLSDVPAGFTVDISAASYNGTVVANLGTAEQLDLASKCIDFVTDSTKNGRVIAKAGNVYVPATTAALSGGITRAISVASAGDSITVAAGTFPGALDVNKSVSLKGANAGTSGTATRGAETVISVAGDYGVQIGAQNVSLDGFTVTNSAGGAVRVMGAAASDGNVSGASIANNILSGVAIGTGSGSDVSGVVNLGLGTGHAAAGFAVSNNSISATGSIPNGGGVNGAIGVRIADSAGVLSGSVTVSGNRITGPGSAVANGSGVFMNPSAATAITVSNNEVADFIYGIRASGLANPSIAGNTFKVSVAVNGYDVLLQNGSGGYTIGSGNQFWGSTGAIFAGTANIGADISATGSSFRGVALNSSTALADLFAIENQISHKVDKVSRGFVRAKTGEVFVSAAAITGAASLATPENALYNAIEAASDGDVIRVEDGAAFVLTTAISKSVTFSGTFVITKDNIPTGSTADAVLNSFVSRGATGAVFSAITSDMSNDQLNAVSNNYASFNGGVGGGISLTSSQSAAQINTLLADAAVGSALANATGMNAGQLDALASNASKLATNGVTGTMLVTSGSTDSTLAALLAKTSSAATVNVDATGLTATALSAVASNIAVVDEIANLSLTNAQSAGEITALLSESVDAASTGKLMAVADATSMSAAKLNALGASYAKLGDNGITGSVGLNSGVTDANFTSLFAKISLAATVRVDGASLGASTITIVSANIGKVDSAFAMSVTNSQSVTELGNVLGVSDAASATANATGMDSAAGGKLATLANNYTKFAANGISGSFTITSGLSSSQITNLLSKVDYGTGNSFLPPASITVDAAGMTGGQLSSLAAAVAGAGSSANQDAVFAISNLTVGSSQSSTDIAILLNSTDSGEASVDATGMTTDQLAAVANDPAAVDQISGTIEITAALTDAQIQSLVGNASTSSSSVVVNTDGMSAAQQAAIYSAGNMAVTLTGVDKTNDVMIANVTVSNLPQAAVGVQVRVLYDATKIAFDPTYDGDNDGFADSIGGTDFPQVVFVTPGTGMVTFATGVDIGGDGTGIQAGNVAKLPFRLIVPFCDTSELVSISTSGFQNRLTTNTAASIPFLAVGSSFVSSLNNLQLAGVPASNISVPADAGTTAGAAVTQPTVTASNNCEASVPVTFVVTYPGGATGTTWPARFPVGVSSVTWSTTDDGGNTATATRTYTVANYQLATVNVDLGTVVPAGITFNQDIRLRLSSGDVVTVTVPFTRNDGTTIDAQIPVRDDYTCITAKDAGHTLADAQALTVSGTKYVTAAAFTLTAGDSNDDNTVDILDFGVFVSDRGAGKNASSRSNFNRDAFVNNADFGSINLNFLAVGETCGGGFFDGNDQPLARISVKELRRRGLGELQQADINMDGWVDQTDIGLAIQGQFRPDYPNLLRPEEEVELPNW